MNEEELKKSEELKKYFEKKYNGVRFDVFYKAGNFITVEPIDNYKDHPNMIDEINQLIRELILFI